MSDQRLQLNDPRRAHPRPPLVRPLGRCLVENGIISQVQLVGALAKQARLHAPIGEILVAEGASNREDILDALAAQTGVPRVDPMENTADAEIWNYHPPEFWIGHGVAPCRQFGPLLQVATERPDLFDAVEDAFSGLPCLPVPVLAPRHDIEDAIARQFTQTLAAKAETRVASQFSCRNRRFGSRVGLLLFGLLALISLATAPMMTFLFCLSLSVLTLALFLSLRLVGFVAHLLSHSFLQSTDHRADIRDRGRGTLPTVSVIVPLYQEREIADALIRRLEKLSYPKALLDVILVLEAKDDVTRKTVGQIRLPPWMRVLEAPEGSGLTTKPRAMNYALDFCRGEIIGVWDAEDAPQPDQIERVAAHFAQADEQLACVQGILDYYNPRTNWRARCFTIEYASWFRVILPGLARMRLVVPLGGTTLFIRKRILEQLGGWDAHNVTEDADLGLRLCRAGYRTEMIDTVTFEEANHRRWPWIRQRSRWLKGFMVTYLVHMRHPLALWRDLGAWRFFGVQAFFLGTLGQFLLAPVLWSFWLIALGQVHPLGTALSAPVFQGCALFFVTAELVAALIGCAATTERARRFLLPWIVTMPLYYAFGVVAAYKAVFELVVKPSFWDKTQHGQAQTELPED